MMTESAASEVPHYFKSPAELIEELGITSPRDLVIEAIAQYCGATILYEHLKGSEARIIGFQDKAIITVSRQAIRSRQRFSAAHELGHWMWDRGKMVFSCGGGGTGELGASATLDDNQMEKRANRYAAELLLPESFVRRSLDGKRLTFDVIETVASDYQTSFSATAIRLVELVPQPCALVRREEGQVRWKYVNALGQEAWSSPEEGFSLEQQILPVEKNAAYVLVYGSLPIFQ
jgi:Zn-dependent peptidase ImmA (M78 family)